MTLTKKPNNNQSPKNYFTIFATPTVEVIFFLGVVEMLGWVLNVPNHNFSLAQK